LPYLRVEPYLTSAFSFIFHHKLQLVNSSGWISLSLSLYIYIYIYIWKKLHFHWICFPTNKLISYEINQEILGSINGFWLRFSFLFVKWRSPQSQNWTRFLSHLPNGTQHRICFGGPLLHLLLSTQIKVAQTDNIQ
jgi:hypothetical protein